MSSNEQPEMERLQYWPSYLCARAQVALDLLIDIEHGTASSNGHAIGGHHGRVLDGNVQSLDGYLRRLSTPLSPVTFVLCMLCAGCGLDHWRMGGRKLKTD